MKTTFFMFIIFLFCPFSSFAGWEGPEEVLSGEWGTNDNQFGIMKQSIKIYLPNIIIVDVDSNVVIGDILNKRVKIYTSSGNLINILKPNLNVNPITWSTPKMSLYGKNILLIWGKHYQSYNFQGAVVAQFELTQVRFWAVNDHGDIIVFDFREKKYIKYSKDGVLLANYDDKPLELGFVSTNRIGEETYKTTIKYPEKEWVIMCLSGKPAMNL
jgi:hypothetical protein